MPRKNRKIWGFDPEPQRIRSRLNVHSCDYESCFGAVHIAPETFLTRIENLRYFFRFGAANFHWFFDHMIKFWEFKNIFYLEVGNQVNLRW